MDALLVLFEVVSSQEPFQLGLWRVWQIYGTPEAKLQLLVQPDIIELHDGMVMETSSVDIRKLSCPFYGYTIFDHPITAFHDFTLEE